MRKLIGCFLIMCCIPLLSYATWKVSDPVHGIAPRHLTTQQLNVKHDYPEQLANGKRCSVEVYPGSLRSNVERAALEYGWYVRWRAPSRYHVIVPNHIVGPNFPVVMNELLSHYPQLRARYNPQLRTMEVFLVGTGHLKYSK